MTITSKLAAAAVLLASALPSTAAIYMTGSYDPWGIEATDQGSPEAAMDRAFGKKDWTKVQGFTTDVFGNGNSFVYVEGGDSVGIADFLNTGGRDALEAFVNAGGAVFVNAARNDSYDALNAGFGLTLLGSQFSDNGSLTNAGLKADFDKEGAGKSWTGTSFSHDMVSCTLAACTSAISFLTGDMGDIVMGGRFGEGYLMVGGQTAPYWQSKGGDKLRANQLEFVADFGAAVEGPAGGPIVAAVPEPATWALLIAGFGMVGAAARRRSATRTA